MVDVFARSAALNIGQTVYLAIVKRAEQGRRVRLVKLPPKLYAEWLDEGHNINSMFKAIGVTVEESEVKAPEFEEAS